ncbi:hypothetical protein ACFSQ0_04325 [Mesonia sediminis]|uniref:HEAT repeat domain-containing protein n=1 Tax=Mesonia sediminis TaxID=1703946 RepID=A0ABW5SC93_9FLAO
MEENLIQLAFYLLPAILVALISYYFFDGYFKAENKKQLFELRRQNSKQTLPIRLQALERLTILLERIDPGSLLIRIKPTSEDKNEYENLLIHHIEQEFEHNISQQIYVSEGCWNAIRATKNATIALIRKTNMSESVDSPTKLREIILSEMMEKSSPSQTGLAYIKQEVKGLW